jgi:hypothetical protein
VQKICTQKKLAGLDAQLTKLEDRRSTLSAREQRWLFERATEQRQWVLDQIARLDELGLEHLHMNEPDARVMRVDPRPLLAYNAQAVVDHEYDLIVAVGMTTEENDSAQLVPMLEEAKRILSTPARQTLVDKGFAAGHQIDDAQRRHLPVVVQLQTESDKGLLPKSAFVYDEQHDVYICPTGELLTFEDARKMERDARCETSIYRCHNQGCPERAACTTDRKGRTVKRMPYDDAVVIQRELLAQPATRTLYELRKEIIEHHFGDIKSNYGFRRFTVRGLAKVFAQWVLACLASNLRKLCPAWVADLLPWAPGMAYP